MGGTLMLALPIIGVIAIGVLVVTALAAALFIAATLVSVVFAVGTKKRRLQGKKLKGLIAIPIIMYMASVPVLVWFSLHIAYPIIDADLTTRYDDCSQAVVSHDPLELRECLQNLTDPLPFEGEESWEDLLALSVEYGDEACVRIVLNEAKAQEVPLDVNAPLTRYDSEGNVSEVEPPLLMALGFSYNSPEMISTLLDEGANPNVVVSSSEGIESPELMEGETPLHLACRGVAGISVYTDSNDHDALQVLEETDEVVDLLFAHGANPSVKDAEGRTPWNNYTALVERFVENGDLSSEEAAQILENRKDILNE